MKKSAKNRQKTEKATQVKYTIDYSESKSISTWGYVGYSLLWFALPIVGLVFWVCACFSRKNKNVRNYARSQFIFALFVLILAAAAVALWYFDVITLDMIKSFIGFDAIKSFKAAK